MKYWISMFMMLLMMGCTVPESEWEDLGPASSLKDFGPAPELENEIWLNTEKPLRLEELRGSVVLVEMWTYG